MRFHNFSRRRDGGMAARCTGAAEGDAGITTITDDKIALRALLEKGSDATFLREMIGFAAQRLMELESEALCGAGHGERSAERRNERNGYRDRDWETRAGTVELRIPKLRRPRRWPRRRSRGTTKIDTQTHPNDVRYDRRHKRQGGGTWGAGLLYSTLLSRWSAAVFLRAAPNRHNSPRRSLCCRLPRWSAVPRLRVKRGRRP
jgi:hypothetical protein